ncbi:hypothetical protein KC921_01200 [Candidatus Woesebacteria bacterium]|nr:hypothetical protein [Candidatus Woesebacteria bacterium]
MKKRPDLQALPNSELMSIMINKKDYGDIDDVDSVAHAALKEKQRRKEKVEELTIDIQKEQINSLKESVELLLNRFDRIIELLHRVVEDPKKSFLWILGFAVLSGIAINVGTSIVEYIGKVVMNVLLNSV